MNNTEINRQIVQEGLERRAEDAKKLDAALEADARILREKISENHTEKCKRERMRSTASQKAQEEAFLKHEELEAERYERREQARQEAQGCICWYQCMLRTFAPLFAVAFAMNMCTNNFIPLWLAITIAVFGITLSVLTLFIGFISQAMEVQHRENVYS